MAYPSDPRTLSRLLTCLCALLLLASGCDFVDDNTDDDRTLVTEGIVVGNGGVFGGEGGRLTIYDPETDVATDTGPLGGFINSLAFHNDRLYVLTNSGDFVNILDVAPYEQVGQIGPSLPPRYIAFAGNDKAFVTHQNFGATGAEESVVSVIDLASSSITTTVDVGVQPEGLAIASGKVFVANAGGGGTGRRLSVIDAATNDFLGSVDLGCDGPNEVFVDEDDEIVVVCEGVASFAGTPTNGQVVFLDSDTEDVTGRIQLGEGVGSANGSQTAYYDALTETLHIIDGVDTVYRVDTDANALDGSLTVPSADDLTALTAVAYDGTTRRLYVARLANTDNPFGSEGSVVILDDAGSPVGRFQAGIAPSHIEVRRVAR